MTVGDAGVRIAVHGATGRLGRLIVAEAGARYAGPVSREGEVPMCDVVIDVSTPDGLRTLLPRLHGQALVVGTTGELPSLVEYAKTAPVAVVPNFSSGVPVMLELARLVRERLPEWDIEIVEVHHNAKRDAPSGTAKRLREALGTTGTGGTSPTHSLRVGDTVGEHTLWLAGPGERLEIKHVATRREVFAWGALRCAEWLRAQAPGIYPR